MIRHLSHSARRTLLGATAALALFAAAPVHANSFIADRSDYASNAAWATAIAKASQDMRDGKFVGRPYSTGSFQAKAGTELTAIERAALFLDGNSGGGQAANPK